MANNGTGQNSSGYSEGFSAGLKFWLFFLLSFVLVGYPIPLSIFLGAIGGLAGGSVVAWWKSKDEPSAAKPAATEAPQEIPAKLSGFRLAKQKRDNKAKNRRSSGRQGVAGLLFGKTGNSSKSNRP